MVRVDSQFYQNENSQEETKDLKENLEITSQVWLMKIQQILKLLQAQPSL